MKIFWLLTIAILIQTDVYAAECPPTTASIQLLLDEAFIPGAAFIVVNSTDIIYEQGIGYHTPPIFNDRRHINPSNSIFLLASISKTFVGVAAMQMVESNLLKLDVDINLYLTPQMKVIHPHYPNRTITMRNLLSHSSGIRQNIIEEYKLYVPGDDFTKRNLSDVITMYLSHENSWLPVPPGNLTYYSNIGTGLAAHIIELLAGISFEEYVRENILKPLDIDTNNASYRLSTFQNNQINLVDHYIYNASWLESFQQLAPYFNFSRVENSSDWFYAPFFSFTIYPAGMLRMTAHSLSKFLRSFLNDFHNILHNPQSIDEMLSISPQMSYVNMSNVEFSLGWYWEIFDGRRFIGHDGSLPGVRTSMMANEKRNLGVIILTNGDIIKNDEQAQKVKDTIVHLMIKLFDCFETKTNAAFHQHVNIIYIWWTISILYFFK
ncbi:unnamed protein product [Adineta steineri]|uniref:Beta-lactamase-related domain-containing protein n=1 Tax=Adineta steineri TaxID=433720 RepID=A0A813SN94_9BILA|nr:unnamed protein product [Adineta steineri]CAF0797514.1 unnamed protein product [Adineta steineri]